MLSASDQAHPRFFEDLQLGQQFRTAQCAVPESSMIEFALQFDPQPMHCDPDGARQSMFNGLIASGWHTAALTMKLMVEAEVLGSTDLIGVEVDRMRFVQPLRPNVSFSAEAIVIQKRPSRNHQMGYVALAITTCQVDGTVLLTQQWTLLVPRRNDENGSLQG